jgi:hypothetical protein
MVDVPLIRKKGDLHVDAGVSAAASVNGTVSYGLTGKIALQAYGNYGEDIIYHQGAFGYYKNLGNNKVMEVYSGIGLGYGRSRMGGGPGSKCGPYQLLFTQLNIGKLNVKRGGTDFGFGIKTGYLHSSMTDFSYFPVNGNWDSYRRNYIDHNILLEPVLILRSGGEHLRFFFKIGGTYLIHLKFTDYQMDYGLFNFGLGLHYRL